MNIPHSASPGAAKSVAWTLLGAALFAIAIGWRHALEQTMARHMLVQIPLLLGAGIACSLGLRAPARVRSALRGMVAWDEFGLTGLVAFLLATGFWMIPRALDGAVASDTLELAKIASLLVAGLLLPASLARANVIVQLFFLGNFASMMAIVGMLYQDTSARLCNFYLVDDQVVAGTGLVVLAVVLPLLWCLCVKRVRDYFAGKSTH